MPRAKKPQTDKSKAFVCPECGRTFTRAASLGAHRRQAHNVAGATSQARAQTAKPANKTSRTATTTTRQRRTRTRTTKTTVAPAKRSSSPSNSAINRDALLQTLFPNGIPAKESVIRSANNWLDEAERLTRLR
jgi:C2H2 type zinc finger protein